jgi:hypothetical protein
MCRTVRGIGRRLGVAEGRDCRRADRVHPQSTIVLRQGDIVGPDDAVRAVILAGR